MLKFSIITPTYNRGEFLRGALDSVSRQGYRNYEHIIIDAMSTDETADILGSRSDIVWIREKDDGLYDAINKGISRSVGDVIVLLNSDDLLLDGALECAAVAMSRLPHVDSYCAPVEMGSVDGSTPIVRLPVPRFEELTSELFFSGIFRINGRFFRRGVFNKIGIFNNEYKVAADVDFLARCLVGGVSSASGGDPIYRYQCHEGSLTLGGSIISIDHLNELISIADDGGIVKENRAFYRRWGGWLRFYRMVRFRRWAYFVDFWSFVRKNKETLAPLMKQIFLHISSRSERRGAPY
ncbi:glycosyltransferase [Chelatococcus daeguensis]|uniref:glycosyltransferase n=1 Tax=Chelatococcus daeguensis TaxID=444444 RepID=UPI0009042191|nr:glycosyltransferase [Chelatococcus daeguensis]